VGRRWERRGSRYRRRGWKHLQVNIWPDCCYTAAELLLEIDSNLIIARDLTEGGGGEKISAEVESTFSQRKGGKRWGVCQKLHCSWVRSDEGGEGEEGEERDGGNINKLQQRSRELVFFLHQQ
jgi:hypothetical protein